MRKNEKNQTLMKKYPKLFVKKNMYWCGIDCHDGWYDLLDRLCSNIQQLVDGTKCDQVTVAQVKEKFGGLRFYINGGPAQVHELINMAEEVSYKICESCGKPGKLRRKQWIATRCNECQAEEEKE